MDFCLCYGVVTEDASDDIFSSASDRKYNSSTRLSYCGPLSRSSSGDALSPRKRKSRPNSGGGGGGGGGVDNSRDSRGRAKRAATRGVSYAEY
jgi:hypothetical protein